MNLRTFETQCPHGNECGSFTRVNGSLRFLGIRAQNRDALGISPGAGQGPHYIACTSVINRRLITYAFQIDDTIYLALQ